jgi:5-methylcytosine-specific restriction endonuclease McrBC regulatory subunit McrC
LGLLSDNAYGFLTPHVRETRGGSETISLEAGPYVGTLPLRNGDTLYILPRVGRNSFSRMLFRTEGLDETIRKEFDALSQLG